MSALTVFGIWFAGTLLTAAIMGRLTRSQSLGATASDALTCCAWPAVWFGLLVMFVFDVAGGRIR